MLVCFFPPWIFASEACRRLGCMEMRRNTTEKQVMEETGGGKKWGKTEGERRKRGVLDER